MELIEPSLYKKIREVMPVVCVDLLVTNATNQFLLLKRAQSPAKGLWWFPGGRILKDETWHDACSRKASQELSVFLQFIKFVSIEESIFKNETPFIHTVNIVAHMFYDGRKQITLASDHTEMKWRFSYPTDLHSCIKTPLAKLGFPENVTPGI
jgi:ADP-ribose pyrophosphatase YjhB (NUDIX family)